MTARTWSRCSRAASSGTTPPKGPWMASWLSRTRDRSTGPAGVSSTTAAEQSSQEDSKPRTSIRQVYPGGQSVTES